jgi:hypothetical protein
VPATCGLGATAEGLASGDTFAAVAGAVGLTSAMLFLNLENEVKIVEE